MFLKLKNPKNFLFWANIKKNQKNKKPTGLSFFFNPGFFQPCLQHAQDKLSVHHGGLLDARSWGRLQLLGEEGPEASHYLPHLQQMLSVSQSANMESDLQSLFGLLCTAVVIG